MHTIVVSIGKKMEIFYFIIGNHMFWNSASVEGEGRKLFTLIKTIQLLNVKVQTTKITI